MRGRLPPLPYAVAVTTPKSRRALARHAWTLMFDILMRSAPQRAESLGRRGLTPNDSRALHTLDERGCTMGSLAQAWRCDASNATWIVNRLEAMGLAERCTMPGDRRVKWVVLTARGAALRAELMEEFQQPPAELLALDAESLASLAGLLATAAGESGSGSRPARSSRRRRASPAQGRPASQADRGRRA